MSRKKPDIVVPYDSKAKSNDLIQNIFDDMFVTNHTPDSINLDGIKKEAELSLNKLRKIPENTNEEMNEFVKKYNLNL